VVGLGRAPALIVPVARSTPPRRAISPVNDVVADALAPALEDAQRFRVRQ